MVYKRLVLASVVIFLLGGCMAGMTNPKMGHDNKSGMDHSQMPMGNMPASETMTGTQMSGMDHSMMADPNQPIDAQFIDGMIVHHQGAVTMANEVLQKAERPELKSFAETIIAAQTQEISDMQSWRKTWYPELAPTGGMGMSMGDMAISDDASKPFDQRFLEAMISHHQGAIDMAQMTLQMQPEHAEVKTLAEAIIKAQEAEIEQMKTWLKEWFGVSISLSSPYAAQLVSPVRGLSAHEVDDLLTGNGMGFARMAELNSYPGPRHVLDLQKELTVSAEQATQIQAIFAEMHRAAQTLGKEIVMREDQLSAAFAASAISETELARQVEELADLYGQLRLTHLRAHLQVTPLLTPDQIARYNALRGYSDASGMSHSQMEHGAHQ